MKKPKEIRKPNLLEAIIPVLLTLALLLLSLLVFKVDIHIPLIIGTIVVSFVAVFRLHCPWADMEKGIFATILQAMQAILIVGIIGMIIGTWIQGGIVPAIIYYGLKILMPKFFLVTSMVICSIVSVATGSAWTTAGTIGIALIGIGTGMGLPAPLVAGSIISGAYFGDKMSPLSDTTNLAPAMAGATLFDHVKHMVHTTSVSYVLAIIAFGVMNFRYVSDHMDVQRIQGILTALSDNFFISPWLLVPPLLIIAIIAFKIPALPGLMLSVFIGAFCAFAFQGASLGEIGNAIQYGVVSQTGNQMIDELLTRGGLQSMMWTLSLVLCSLSFGGALEKSGMLDTIAHTILRVAKTTGQLIMVTVLSSIFMNVISGEQYLSILITGRMFKREYELRGLAPKNLSRCLEDGGTLTSPLVPWCTCAVAMSSYLGVPTLAYLPYCFFNLINPIVSIIYGFTGYTIEKIPPAKAEEKIEATSV